MTNDDDIFGGTPLEGSNIVDLNVPLAPDTHPAGTYVMATINRCNEIVSLVFDLTGHEGFIAGGFARYCLSEKEEPIIPGDIDVFCENEATFNAVVKRLRSNPRIKRKTKTEIETKFEYHMGNEGYHKNTYSIQVIRPTQIMNMVSDGNYERVLDNFDFTIAKAAILSDGTALVHEKFEEHDNANKLVLTNIHCPISSMKRVIKYCQKGYFIESAELLKLFKDYENRSPEWKSLVNRGLNSANTDMSREDRKAFIRTMYFD